MRHYLLRAAVLLAATLNTQVYAASQGAEGIGGLPSGKFPISLHLVCQATLGILIEQNNLTHFGEFKSHFEMVAKKGETTPFLSLGHPFSADAWTLMAETAENPDQAVFAKVLDASHRVQVELPVSDDKALSKIQLMVFLDLPDSHEVFANRSVSLKESNFDSAVFYKTHGVGSYSSISLEVTCTQKPK